MKLAVKLDGSHDEDEDEERRTKNQERREVGTEDWREERFHGMFASRSFDGRLRQLRHYTNDTPVSFHGESAPFSCVSPLRCTDADSFSVHRPLISFSSAGPCSTRTGHPEEREKYRQIIVDPAQAGCAPRFLAVQASDRSFSNFRR